MKRTTAQRELEKKNKRLRKAARDAEDGQYTSFEYARKNPKTTVIETYPVESKDTKSDEVESNDE